MEKSITSLENNNRVTLRTFFGGTIASISVVGVRNDYLCLC